MQKGFKLISPSVQIEMIEIILYWHYIVYLRFGGKVFNNNNIFTNIFLLLFQYYILISFVLFGTV